VFSSGNHEFEDRLQVDGDLGVIHFRPLIKEDEGEYRCHSFSEAGEDSATGYLRVLSNRCFCFFVSCLTVCCCSSCPVCFNSFIGMNFCLMIHIEKFQAAR